MMVAFCMIMRDEFGTAQIAREAPPDPSGASGLDTRSVML